MSDIISLSMKISETNAQLRKAKEDHVIFRSKFVESEVAIERLEKKLSGLMEQITQVALEPRQPVGTPKVQILPHAEWQGK